MLPRAGQKLLLSISGRCPITDEGVRYAIEYNSVLSLGGQEIQDPLHAPG